MTSQDTASEDAGEQLTLLPAPEAAPRAARSPGKGARPVGALELSSDLPVARVVLDLSPHHLDRTFDYLVPAAMAAGVQPGVRVKARFGPQEVDGFVLARAEHSDHDGRLVPLKRLVSPEQVLTPQVAQLCRTVADHYAGTLSDVLRLAIPPRHARAEAAPSSNEPVVPDAPADPSAGAPGPASAPEPAAPGARAGARNLAAPVEAVDAPAGPARPSEWAPYRGGAAFLNHLVGGSGPRAVWTALPGRVADGVPVQGARAAGGRGAGDEDPAQAVQHWALALAEAVRATVTGGRGALVVLPDARDVDQMARALELAGYTARTARQDGQFVRLTADEGPSPRYRSFLAALRGEVPIVIGTRAAAFAPVQDLGLVACWNDGEETLAEPRSPYPHAREVLALRSELEGAAFLLGSVSRTVQAQALLESGWAREVAAPREVLRARAPRVRALTSVELASEGAGAAARLPSAAWRAVRDALGAGPVLVQVPRAGYMPVVACARCRTAAHCGTCHGPLMLPGPGAPPQCAWCGALAGAWSCDECHWTGLRSVRVGSGRTAEELGRAFPGVAVRVSGASAPGGVIAAVGPRPAVVVATPGAEPVAEGGYAAALLLDAALSTAHVGLAVAQDALHRWLAAAGLVRSAREGGQVLLVGDAAPGPTNALVRWDPAGFADRELAERRELDLPPAVRVAAVTGDRQAVDAVVARVGLADASTTLGPVEVAEAAGRPARGGPARDPSLQPPVRTIVRVPLREGRRLARELSASLAVRSAKREGGTVRVQLDPKEML
ncbi:primosomal protein N' [Oerskovia sp. Root918]|uniref:primosomal protein N' n=1 Tax=Oerskovia sp. Root918 TaxID=1736607 RepID=UPI0006FBAFE5|nr:primosomal protein N' [Oerskovia sp. Root918]KRD36300.1 primosomal protein N' [Oerskovia sp. Root918]